MGTRGCRQAVMPGLEVIDKVLFRPIRNSFMLGAVQVRCEPALDHIALQCVAGLVAAEHTFGRMAGRAMPQPLDQIPAAIPGRGFCWILLEFSGGEVQAIPRLHAGADIEWKGRRLVFTAW